jgi:lysophospholipid acyltransferase (LPLAT)-like uncharacterized protein
LPPPPERSPDAAGAAGAAATPGAADTAGTALGLGWRLVAWPAVLVTHAIVWALAATWRFQVTAGQDVVDDLRKRPRPVLVCAWHESLYPACAWLLRGPLGRALRLGLLVSHSRDGELVSRLLGLWGAHVVRGSSSLGGRAGLQALYRAVRRDGVSPLALPDGPRGPARRSKPGALVLAISARVPVVPLAFRVDRAWRLRSWDRILMPKPFARIGVLVGRPREVPDLLDPAHEAHEVRLLDARLDDPAHG